MVGKTYGVYVSRGMDKILSNEVTVRKMNLDNLNSVPKLMAACVLYVVRNDLLSQVPAKKSDDFEEVT